MSIISNGPTVDGSNYGMSPSEGCVRKGIWKKVFLAILLLGVLAYFGDVSSLIHLPEIKWGFFILIFLCTLFFTLSHNFRWKGIVDHLSDGKGESFFSLYRYLLNGYAFGMVIPLDVSLAGLRSYYLKRSQKLTMSLAIFSVFLDRFLDVIILITMATPSFLFITGVASTKLSMGIVFVSLVGLLGAGYWKKGETFSFLLKGYRIGLLLVFSRLPVLRKWIPLQGEGIEAACHFDSSSVYLIMGWNFIKYFFLTLRFYFTGQALGVVFSPIQAFFFIPFIQLSGFVNLTPGGLGVVEAGTYGALVLMGIPKSQILLFVFGQRVLFMATFFLLFMINHLFFFFQSKSERMDPLNGNN